MAEEKKTTTYKLPSSGIILRIPAGIPEAHIPNYIFYQLKNHPKLQDERFDRDRKLVGDEVDTTGIGAAIGGTIGSIGGAVLGTLGSPSLVVNPITGSIAGGASGSAIGEGIEQLVTGKGDWGDIGQATIEGGAWSAVPAAGAGVAHLAKNAPRAGKYVAGLGGSGAAGAGVNTMLGGDPTTGAAIGVGGAFFAPIIGKLLSPVVKNVRGQNPEDAIQQAEGGVNKIIAGYTSKIRGIPLAGAQIGAGKQDLKRAAGNAVWNFVKKQFIKKEIPWEEATPAQKTFAVKGLAANDNKPAMVYIGLDGKVKPSIEVQEVQRQLTEQVSTRIDAKMLMNSQSFVHGIHTGRELKEERNADTSWMDIGANRGGMLNL